MCNSCILSAWSLNASRLEFQLDKCRLSFRSSNYYYIMEETFPIFQSISGEERGEQAILLLSPSMQPVEDKGVTSTSSSSSSNSSGNMFTFFLTAPLLAFWRVIETSSKNMSKVIERCCNLALVGCPFGFFSSSSKPHQTHKSMV